MIYSYTQIAQYLRCPRSYRYRYLDGWQEKETRAALAFGRCFETALGAYFREEDCGATLFREWGAYRDTAFDRSEERRVGKECRSGWASGHQKQDEGIYREHDQGSANIL